MSKAKRLYAKAQYGALQGKNLRNVLIRKLIKEYGYDNKLRIAEVLVDDFLDAMEEYTPKQGRLKPGQLVWYAVDVKEQHTQGKKLKDVKLVPVKLTVIDEEDLKNYADGMSSKEIRRSRMVRMFREAKEQGGVLSQTDMAVLLGYRVDAVSKNLLEIRKESGLVPTRGSVHDLGRTITHKKEIINLYLQGYLTPEIARLTKHDATNVDRYIRDYERVKALVGKFDERMISHLTKLTKTIVREYLDIIRENNIG
jgi:hypothetical protein